MFISDKFVFTKGFFLCVCFLNFWAKVNAEFIEDPPAR